MNPNEIANLAERFALLEQLNDFFTQALVKFRRPPRPLSRIDMAHGLFIGLIQSQIELWYRRLIDMFPS